MIRTVARYVPLLPLGWLLWRSYRHTVPLHLWWISVAYAVSWVANMAAAHGVDPWLSSLVYPLSQAMLIALVFVDRPRPAMDLLMVLVGVAIMASWWQTLHPGPDVLLHSVAFGAVAMIAWKRPQLGMLRTSLLVSFGVWLVCWWGYVLLAHRSAAWAWTTWGAFQSARLVGEVLFCKASVEPVRRLRVA